jgi:hypothetical protein
MIHNFDQSLQDERSQTHIADEFYRTQLNANKIIRYSNDTAKDMKMQKKDIDASVFINDKEYFISEKFRNKDYGDIYIELYSKYPHTKGWLEQNHASALLYFTPQKVHWIGYPKLHWFAHNLLFGALNNQTIDEFANKESDFSSCEIIIQQKHIPIKLIKAPNLCDGSSWTTIGISIKTKHLQIFGINIKTFDLVKEN